MTAAFSQEFMAAKEKMLQGKRYINVQIGDKDVQGRRFNGYDLHFKLQDHGYRSFDIVAHKQSTDPSTLLYARSFASQILHSMEFILSDIVHLQLIHNTNFDLQLLPLLSSMKPTILTLHDPFFLGGHCVHPMDCEKWRSHCMDCPHLDAPFALQKDTSALLFAQKKRVFDQSQLHLIVTSDWMLDMVRQSPILQNKKPHLLPFGVDQRIFCPGDRSAARKALGIPTDRFTVLFRAETHFKGIDIVQDALQKLRCEEPVTVLAVGFEKGLLRGLPKNCMLVEQGWVAVDRQMATLYQACDLLLMPSRVESFGLMAVEAMSCGKTVLSIHGTALPSVIQSPGCGIAVDKKEYADMLQTLYNNRAMRQAHGERSLAYAKNHYGEAQYIKGMVDIYHEVMEAHRADADASIVLQQLFCYGPHTEPQEPLFRTASWKITKPLRIAKKTARALKQGLSSAFRAFRDGLRQPDQANNESIMESASWKLTRPLRAFFGMDKARV